ncbi:MAG: DUF1697 domain-containing protein [Micromonosporaceae bacterium]|jgi:uncharacterized protein (DUF1697 family)|nr:DUF1697 domain-containing protein [Micromonosporaceae bacterium]
MAGRTTGYAALLRGVNLGSHGRVSMADLGRLFMDLGLEQVSTYLQSGNVIFAGPATGAPSLAAHLQQRIAKDLGLDTVVILRSRDELGKIVGGNPYVDRTDDPTKLVVTFLAEPSPEPERLTAPAGETAEFTLAGQEVYLYCPDGYGRTKLSNAFLERRLRVAATTRNWRTVTKLHELTSQVIGA